MCLLSTAAYWAAHKKNLDLYTTQNSVETKKNKVRNTIKESYLEVDKEGNMWVKMWVKQNKRKIELISEVKEQDKHHLQAKPRE